MKLRDRFRRDFANWQARVPEPWRDRFDGVELTFDAVDPGIEIGDNEPVWPQDGIGPQGAETFNAFRRLDPDAVRVVVFGNDPYTKLKQATGRSFEQGDVTDWATDAKEPGLISPSLQSLLCAAAATAAAHQQFDLVSLIDLDPDEGFEWRAHRELTRGLAGGSIVLPAVRQLFDFWTDQHVLWLNRTLTYSRWLDGHRPAHTALWAPFTERVIEVLLRAADRRGTPVVFALWGAQAQALEAVIKAARERLHLPSRVAQFAKAAHPQLAGRYFMNGNPLDAINELLDDHPIRWFP